MTGARKNVARFSCSWFNIFLIFHLSHLIGLCLTRCFSLLLLERGVYDASPVSGWAFFITSLCLWHRLPALCLTTRTAGRPTLNVLNSAVCVLLFLVFLVFSVWVCSAGLSLSFHPMSF